MPSGSSDPGKVLEEDEQVGGRMKLSARRDNVNTSNSFDRHKVVVLKVTEEDIEGLLLNHDLNDEGKLITLLDITEDKAQTNKDIKLDLLNAFSFLNEDEKELIINRYYKDFTQSEIANMLGVNQVYVSRMEKKALTKMKVKMM